MLARGETGDDTAAIRAQHLLDALDALPGDEDVPVLRARAIGLLRGAAQRARSLGLSAEAAEHLREALRNEDDAVRQAAIRSELAVVLLDMSQYEETVTLAQEATEVFDAASDAQAAGLAAATWAMALALTNHQDKAVAVAPSPVGPPEVRPGCDRDGVGPVRGPADVQAEPAMGQRLRRAPRRPGTTGREGRETHRRSPPRSRG